AVIDNADSADTRAGQYRQYRAAQPSCPNNQHTCIEQPLLRIHSEAGKYQLAMVTRIYLLVHGQVFILRKREATVQFRAARQALYFPVQQFDSRSEEHTSELQSR